MTPRLLLIGVTASLVATAACADTGDADDSAATAAGGSGSPTSSARHPAPEPSAQASVEPSAERDSGERGIDSPESADVDPAFDLLATRVSVAGDEAVFRSTVVDAAGAAIPEPAGGLDGAPVWSYVWPTTLDSAVVGFEPEQGILALAATSHPDFDDTPLYDENGDGDPANDGADWHAHWVVLVEDASCDGQLSVKPIPEGATPSLPATWPELPILIDSPDYTPELVGTNVELRVPLADIGAPESFQFDGVTAGLRVSTSPHDPLLCVADVFDVASGDLSLPGEASR